MTPKYALGQKVIFANQDAIVKKIETKSDGTYKYYCETGEVLLPMWLNEDLLKTGVSHGPPTEFFYKRIPHFLVIDNFYKDPDAIRKMALDQEYYPNLKFYKGKRTQERFLWPCLREEFERLLGRRIVDWLNQPVNGCFQITGYNDPLVWHSDTQSYAAAVYLTPDAPLSAGTSFWRDKTYGCRRPPRHALEMQRFSDDNARDTAGDDIYSEYNLLHPDNWELVDQFGAVYNRLVIWDAQLIHSASSYKGMEGDAADKARLVQLFFFSVS